MGSFIDAGMPSDWPDTVARDLHDLVQGDVVPSPSFVYHGDPARPVYGTTTDYAEAGMDAGPMVIPEDLVRWALVTSATCDISEEDKKRPIFPFVQVSPIVDLSGADKSQRGLLEKGRYNYLLHVPALAEIDPGFWVVDLRIEYPVEKGWLASQGRVLGFRTESDRQRVGAAVAHLRNRPALASSFYQLVTIPLGERLGQLRQSDPKLADKIDSEIVEWAVQLDSRLAPTRAEIVLLSMAGDASEDVQDWWRLVIDDLRPPASQAPAALVIIGPRFERLDKLPVINYRKLTPLPSPHRRFS